MRPRVLMPMLRFFIGESRVCQAQFCAGSARRKLDRHHSLSAFGGRSEPREFHEPRSPNPRPLEPQETPVMRMAPALELSLEEKRSANLGPHRNRARRGEPEIELLGPSAKKRVWSGFHHAFADKTARPHRGIVC